MDTGDAHVRISDADRTAARRLLEQAVGEGMLTLDEFSERLDVALAARTRGDLEPVLGDLPLRRPAGAPQVPVPTGAAVVLRGRMTTLTRRGPWTVPGRLGLNTRMCDTTLDLRAAVLHSAVVELTIDDYCSSTQIVLPDHATADADGLDTIAGSATVHVATAPPSPHLHLVIRGRVRMGSVTVRHPFGVTLRRFTRR